MVPARSTMPQSCLTAPVWVGRGGMSGGVEGGGVGKGYIESSLSHLAIVQVHVPFPAVAAAICTLHENPLLSVSNNTIFLF